MKVRAGASESIITRIYRADVALSLGFKRKLVSPEARPDNMPNTFRKNPGAKADKGLTATVGSSRGPVIV